MQPGTLKDKDEGKLLAKETGVLKQSPCHDPVFSPAQLTQELSSPPGLLLCMAATSHILPHKHIPAPSRTSLTCRTREARAGCGRLRPRCAGQSIFWSL